MIDIVCIIPARMSSERLPGKPLKLINHKTMLQYVYDAAVKSECFKEVVVATCDGIIAHYCSARNIPYIMTKPQHKTGTDRVAEAVAVLGGHDYIVNLQCDMPFITANDIKYFVKRALEVKKEYVTAYTNAVPTVSDCGIVMDGIRAVDYTRDLSKQIEGLSLGIYFFTFSALISFACMPPSIREQWERIEMLRWINAGKELIAIEVPMCPISVDTKDDLELARRLMCRKKN